jgi:Lrp/AsnC family transcriptional regulator, regulator for asnA, asnC and gidA
MRFKLDAINAKILKDLLQDGRKSFADIAKECKTSKDVISKRFKQMESNGIIVGATVHTSPRFFGGNIVATFFIYTQPNKSEQVFSEVIKLPQVVSLYSVGINPSLAAGVVLKSSRDLDQTKQLLKVLPFVNGLETQVITGMRNNPDNLSLLEVDERASRIKNKVEKETTNVIIDHTDHRIVEKLLSDARTPFSKIAADLELSTDTILRRYEKLRNNGDVKVVIQINPKKIGYDFFAIITLNVMQNKSSLIELLSNMPDVNWVQETTGKYDYFLSVMIRNLEQLVDLQEKISRFEGITRMETSIGRLFPVWPLPKEFIMIH